MEYILTSIGFFLWVIRTTLFWIALWQIKEYRSDRLLVHLRETRQGKSLLFSPFAISNMILVLLYGFVIADDRWTYWYQLVVFFYFSFLGLLFIREIIFAKFKRPAITVKSLTIFFLTIVVLSIGYAFNLVDKYGWLLVLNLLTPVFVGLFVFTFSFPTEIYKDILIQKAKKKILEHKKLLVIGVSGSYGKTSTKEYLAHVLASKFSVVKTPLSNNTPIAVANTILNHVKSTTQILIVEIGSYKKGEVAEICDIIHPTISITTALGEQHISLYGSMENIIQTEKELLQALPRNGLALCNANSPYMERLYNQTKKKTILYGTMERRNKRSVDVLASNISVEKNGISFTAKIKRKVLKLHTALLGAHNVENILPAIYLAKHLGMNDQEIVKAVEKLTPLPKTMKKFTTQEGHILIDDSFNASPESVIAAARYLEVYHHKKLFVLMPLIELGKKAKTYHYEIGKVLGKCDYVFLTNKNFYKDIQKGIQDSKGKCEIIVANSSIIADKIPGIAKKGDVILFEGKEAGTVLSKLL